MLDSVRVRLTVWYIGVLAVVLIAFALLAYWFLARTLSRRTDDSLVEMASAFPENLQAEEREGKLGLERVASDQSQTAARYDEDAAVIDVASEYSFRDYAFVVYDQDRKIVANSSGLSVEHEVPSTPVWNQPEISTGITSLIDAHTTELDTGPVLATLSNGDDEYRVLAEDIQTATQRYTLVVIRPLNDQEDLLKRVGGALFIGVPLALALASVGSYFLARKSLAPVVMMSETAARISAKNLHERLPIANERDELGYLAHTLNQLLSRLDDSFEQQRRFMADASHELRTPVAIVRGESEVALSRDERESADYRESLAIVHDEGRRLTRIVDDLFTLARSDAGQRPLKNSNFYLDEVAAECLRAVRTLAAKRSLILEFDSSHELPFQGDEDLIRRMLLNLLDNAVKYTPFGGRVSLTCEATGDEYTITIKDTGVGIPIESRPHIFDRFYRADKARSRAENSDGSGAGLGLAIARLAAEAHGGRLELLSSSPSGSVFAITLPVPGPLS